MYNFKYVSAKSVADAKAACAANGKIIAGGQTLLPTIKQRLAMYDTLVDITDIKELNFAKIDQNKCEIGAAVCHNRVATCDDTKKHIPAVSYLASKIGDPQVRNLGTIGGSIANNDPAADWPAATLALRGNITTDKRTIKATDFFQDLFETALEDDEIITKITFEVPEVAAYEKFDQPASRFALVGVFVAKYSDQVYVAVTGAGSSGVFLEENLQTALTKDFSIASINNLEPTSRDLITDIHASADYRRHLISVLTKRAVEYCLKN